MSTTPTPTRTRKPFTRKCGWCGRQYKTTSDKSRWCSDACKMHAYRHRRDTGESVTVNSVTEEGNDEWCEA